MKRNKKILLALGSMATVIAPIVSAVSMSTNVTGRASTTLDKVAFDAFTKRVNDDKDVVTGNLDPALLNRFFDSSVYKTEHDWSHLTYEQVDSAIIAIFKAPDKNNGGFDDEEKVGLAKYTIQENMYENFFESVGLDKKSITQTQVEGTSGNLSDPFLSTTSKHVDVHISGKPIATKGSSGLNSDFAANNQTGSVLYNISNQSILEYLVGSIVLSDEFKQNATDLEAKRSDVESGTETLVNIMEKFTQDISNTLTGFATKTFPIEKMVTLSPLEIFALPSVKDANGNNLNDDQYYEQLMLSPLGTHLYGDTTQSKIDSFVNETDSTEKSFMKASLVSDIYRAMRSYYTHDTIPALENVVDFHPQPATAENLFPDPDQKEAVKQFAKLLVENSNQLSSDISLKITGNFETGHALWIKPGHSVTDTWNKVDGQAVTSQIVGLDSDLLKQDYLYKNLPQRGSNSSEKTIATISGAHFVLSLPEIKNYNLLPSNFYNPSEIVPGIKLLSLEGQPKGQLIESFAYTKSFDSLSVNFQNDQKTLKSLVGKNTHLTTNFSWDSTSDSQPKKIFDRIFFNFYDGRNSWVISFSTNDLFEQFRKQFNEQLVKPYLATSSLMDNTANHIVNSLTLQDIWFDEFTITADNGEFKLNISGIKLGYSPIIKETKNWE